MADLTDYQIRLLVPDMELAQKKKDEAAVSMGEAIGRAVELWKEENPEEAKVRDPRYFDEIRPLLPRV